MAAPNAPDIPHFAVPFSVTAAGAAVVEQDTQEEIYGCVQNIVACPVGSRADLPAFGIPYPEFSNAPLNTDGIGGAIRRWEPRAETEMTEYGDLVDTAVRHIHIGVRVAQ